MHPTHRTWPLLLALALLGLYLNFWMWDSDAIVLGFPVNLLYHVGICLLASLAMLVVVVLGWPHELDQDEN